MHDTNSLKMIIENQGAEQVVMGLDDPYPLGEMESDNQSSYPGKILDLALDRKIVTSTEYDAIWDENVVRWLYGDNEKKKEAFKKRILGK